jgi:hypothetical protein
VSNGTYTYEYTSLHKYNSVVTPPTKTEGGYTTHTCTVCNDSYIDSFTDAIGSSGLSYEVNANEWKFALELYHFKNYTLFAYERWEDDPDDKGQIISTIKSNQGIIYGTQIETYNGVTEVETIHRYHQFYYLSDLDAGWISEFGNEIENMTDFGYSKFSYSDETHSYSATMEIDGIPTKVTVKFANGFLVKITLDGQGKYDECDAYECKFTGTYQFYNYNTTENLPTPQK